MKSDIAENRYFIECACSTPEHLLVFDFLNFQPESEYTEMSAAFTNIYYPSWGMRVKQAFKYIFKKQKYLDSSDCIIFDRKNLESFKEVVNKMEEILNEEDERKTREFVNQENNKV